MTFEGQKLYIHGFIYVVNIYIKDITKPLFDMDKINNKPTFPGKVECQIQSSGP